MLNYIMVVVLLMCQFGLPALMGLLGRQRTQHDAECKASASNLRGIQVKDIVKEVKDYLKTYSSAEMDIRCRGGSHVTNVPEFDKEDFSSWKDRFLIYLDGLEPYLLEILENGPFVPLSPLSTLTNPLPKPQNQWSPADRRLANQDKRLKSILISCLPRNVMKSVIKCTSAKAIWTDLILTHEGPSKTRDTKIATLRLKFNAFKALDGEKVHGTFTRLKCLLNDLENNGVSIPQVEVNATFVNSLPRKWLSMNQTQRANNSIKNDTLAALYGKYNYEEGLIDQIYESESTRFSLQGSKALISNPTMQDSDSDIEEDQRSSSEFLADLNAEFHERALLANQRRFYKRSGRVGSSKKPMDRSNETCFACGKLGHFQKDCPSIKTSTPPYPSANKLYNKPKFHTNSTPQHNQNANNNQKDYKVKYKGLKAEIVVLTKKIDAMNKGKSEKGLVAESFDWDEESVSSDDEGVTTFKALMAVADEELSVGRADARSGQWVEITMKKVQKLLSITNNDERKHVFDYTHVDLHYVEDQRKNLLSKYNSLKQEFSYLKNTKALNSSFQNEITKLSLENESLKDEISDLKKVIEKWTSSRVTLDQLLTEQIPRNIVRAIGGKGKRKEKISSKEVCRIPYITSLHITITNLRSRREKES
ncbi:retrovirus-related pol polyprotein from transposon TNT 1-94 [Tanacetum coccineum]|uniref:Retrovirus-related pol polyprotein from transposon TNT 1-94 n=1 Tax=Tanacetum coccineum TaxID=301880 RepID=A0ABQ5I048_9ASTR